MKARLRFPGVHFDLLVSDSDIVNPDEYQPGGHNRGDYRLYCLVDTDTVVGLVFADNESDAMDELADAGKLDAWKVPEEDRTSEEDPMEDDCVHIEGVVFLGNAGDPYVLPFGYQSLFSVPIPKLSLVSIWAAEQGVLAEKEEDGDAKV